MGVVILASEGVEVATGTNVSRGTRELNLKRSYTGQRCCFVMSMVNSLPTCSISR